MLSHCVLLLCALLQTQASLYADDAAVYSMQSLVVQNVNLTQTLEALQNKLSRNCQGILLAGLSKGSGIYTVYPYGQPMQVYCDMNTDEGGWTLVAKIMTTIDNSPLHNDAGHNPSALLSTTFNAIGAMPRHIMANLGLTYRVVSSDNTRRLYWEGSHPYFSDNHASGTAFINTKTSYAASFTMGCTMGLGQHSQVLAQDASCNTAVNHVSIQRFCCAPYNGIWWNGGPLWNPGTYTDGTVWIR